MSAAEKRRVRVVIEGDAHNVSTKCGVLRIDLPADETGLPAVVMVNPSWEGVTVEHVSPAYNWQDDDVILWGEQATWTRHHGRWYRYGDHRILTDGQVAALFRDGSATVVRYQDGAA